MTERNPHPMDTDRPCPQCGAILRNAAAPTFFSGKVVGGFKTWHFCPACKWSERDDNAPGQIRKKERAIE